MKKPWYFVEIFKVGLSLSSNNYVQENCFIYKRMNAERHALKFFIVGGTSILFSPFLRAILLLSLLLLQLLLPWSFSVSTLCSFSFVRIPFRSRVSLESGLCADKCHLCCTLLFGNMRVWIRTRRGVSELGNGWVSEWVNGEEGLVTQEKEAWSWYVVATTHCSRDSSNCEESWGRATLVFFVCAVFEVLLVCFDTKSAIKEQFLVTTYSQRLCKFTKIMLFILFLRLMQIHLNSLPVFWSLIRSFSWPTFVECMHRGSLFRWTVSLVLLLVLRWSTVVSFCRMKPRPLKI